MPPKLRVVAYNAKHEKRLQNEISTSLASILRTNPKLTPKEAMWSVTNELMTNNPYQPPANGKCPINDLPNELLGYIFKVGAKQEELEDLEDEDEEWEDVDSDEEDESGSEVGSASDSGSDNGSDSGSILDIANDSDSDAENELNVPFQVLVSHVCRRWREVALDSHALWTSLDFVQRPRLEKARTYIERSHGLPLNIYIDCTFPEDIDEEDHPDHPLYLNNEARKKAHTGHCDDEECEGHDDDGEEEGAIFLSQQQLSQILDLIEPEVSHWGSLDFRASTYGYVQTLLSRLHNLESAPLLETLQICHFEDCNDYEFFSGDDKTFYLPFHGKAPLLKELALWGVHIDWDAELFHGLKDLELAYHAKDVRPSYKAFSAMINNSPDIQSLTLSLSGPALPEGVPFDGDPEEHEGAWGPTPLTIPSLRDLGYQFHDVKYATALAQHIDAPAVMNMILNFDQEDYTSFVRALASPVKGRTESILQHVDTLKISGLPCDIASTEAFLGQLTKLKGLNIKVVGLEEAMIFEKLLDPKATTPSGTSLFSPSESYGTGQAPLTPLVPEPHSDQPTISGPSVPTDTSASNPELPTIFCPLLEIVTTTEVTGKQIKELIIARRALGAPLKHILMSHHDRLSKKDEKWIRKNVEELSFFSPSDSEEELSDFELEGGVELASSDEDDDGDDDNSADDEQVLRDEHGVPLVSPLVRHLRRGTRGAGGLD